MKRPLAQACTPPGLGAKAGARRDEGHGCGRRSAPIQSPIPDTPHNACLALSPHLMTPSWGISTQRSIMPSSSGGSPSRSRPSTRHARRGNANEGSDAESAVCSRPMSA